jgi:hypothetical protein
MPSLALFISQSSRQRRLYHRTIIETQPTLDCESIISRSIAEGLVQLATHTFEAIALDDTLPIFEVGLFVELLNKKEKYADIQLAVLGFQHQQYIFPKQTVFCKSIFEIVSFLSRSCGTL